MKHAIITEGAEPGRFHAYPYQLGILDAMGDPQYEQVTFKKSKRVGYTQLMTFAQAYFIAADPSPIMLVQPTIDDAKSYSKDSFAPMLEAMPMLRGLVSEAKSRDSKNTIGHKMYPGGSIHFKGANSMAGFRRLTKRVVIGDEIDAWPKGLEGDQIKAMIGRTETYGSRRKIILGSTPLYDETSRVDRHYQMSDQRVYKVPCPRCKELQPISWNRIKWPKDNPERAYMECSECGYEIDHSEKGGMLDAALAFGDQGWHAENTDVLRHAGFWLWAGYSLTASAAWGKIATEFLEVKQDSEELMTFTNEVLGETWQVEGDGGDPNELYRKRRDYFDDIPSAACLLTAGVDVQKDRVEIEVVAWSRHMESWSVDYATLFGDPSRLSFWEEDVHSYLERAWPHENGRSLKISAACIDSGMCTDEVYAYCKANFGNRRYAVKGQAGMGLPTIANMTTKGLKVKGVRLFTLGVDSIKTALFSRLAEDTPGPGYCHFPQDRPLDYFLGLTAEKAVRKYSAGKFTVVYVHDKKIPNEPLDCRVYATAALSILNPSWDAYEKSVSTGNATSDDLPPSHAPPSPARRPVRRAPSRGGWVNTW